MLTLRVLLSLAASTAVLVAAPLFGQVAGTSRAAPDSTLPSVDPSSPVGQQLAWVVGALNDGGQTLTEADVAEHFAPSFLAGIPPEAVIALTQHVAAAFGPFVLEGATRPPTATQANALLATGGGTPLVLPIAVEASSPHRITGLNFAPAPSLATEALGPGAQEARLDGLFVVDGRWFYLSCAGVGSPTVVLESGLNDPAAPWVAVQQAVATFTRVCSYDRANAVGGASDAAPLPRTAADAVADLHTLLFVAQMPGPYVLVGHSFGGIFARLYASTYPEEVAGLVLVDPSHEEQDTRLEALVPPDLWRAYQMSGVLNPEGIDMAASFTQMRTTRARMPLRPMPLIVVTGGDRNAPSVLPAFTPPGWPTEQVDRLWYELHADLAHLVPEGRQVVAEQSGHYVHQSEPEVVVEAIRQVVAAAR
jgi:pimeloyl-ACP methyl ester carboxylesterase